MMGKSGWGGAPETLNTEVQAKMVFEALDRACFQEKDKLVSIYLDKLY